MERRLAAILAADVVGYSRLIRADEEGTIAALKALRADLIDPKLAEHNGRIVKLMGDGMLVEFASVVDAVRAAVETQEAVTEHNADLPENKRIEFRVGVNLGDVVIDGDDIHGDGVNVAARLEGMAEPGGICVSGMVYEGVRDRIDVPFEDLGEQEVKNIDRPVRVYRVATARGRNWSMPEITGDPPVPDKPSIIILPFLNMSRDPDQDFFADGMTEDVITELSRFRSLFVIARSTSFAFKGENIDIKDVGRRLGVQYVLEGSVRKIGNRVRITAQLIEAQSAHHGWVERYDEQLEDIFAVQDAVTEEIVSTLAGSVTKAEMAQSKRARPSSLAAYDLFIRGAALFYRFDRSVNSKAVELLKSATSTDPNFSRAYSFLCNAIWHEGLLNAKPGLNAKAWQAGQRALEIDGGEDCTLAILGAMARGEGDRDRGRELIEEALSLNPYHPHSTILRAYQYIDDGELEEGLEWANRTMRLDPIRPPWQEHCAGLALYCLGRYEEALQSFRRTVPFTTPYVELIMAAACGQLALHHEASDLIRGALKVLPGYTKADFSHEYRVMENSALEHIVEGLRKAGLA